MLFFLGAERDPEPASQSPYWKILECLPKSHRIHELGDMRWIGKSPVLQKWFVRALRPRVRDSCRPSRVHTYGFKKCFSTADFNSVVREALYAAAVWNLPICVSGYDVSIAFDSMPHELMQDSLLARGVTARDVALLMGDLTGLRARITLPLAGTSEPFLFAKGGKQGGVETPDEWNCMTEHLMEPVVEKWTASSMGFKFPDEEGGAQCLLNHAVWVDNFILFATDATMTKTMVDDVNVALGSHTDAHGHRYLKWKPSSPEVMCSGSLRGADPATVTVTQYGETLEYKRVDCMGILGDKFDDAGSTFVSYEHNIRIAEAHYFKHRNVLSNVGASFRRRLKLWHDSTATRACYNCCTWHFTSGLLHAARRWENKMLRRILRLKRRPGESNWACNGRTSDAIRTWMFRASARPLPGRILKAVFKRAWKETAFHIGNGQLLLQDLHTYRNAQWWSGCLALASETKRRKLGLVRKHCGQQPASWERPFVDVWGVEWRSQMATCTTLAQWLRKFGDFRDSLFHIWVLPLKEPVDEVVGRPAKRMKFSTGIDDIPECLANSKEGSWDGGARRVWIQVDNQLLRNIFAGHAQLKCEYTRPVCVRIGRQILQLLGAGVLPRRNTTPFIEWDERQYNAVADHAANVALDTDSDWERICDEVVCRATADRMNLRVCVDGALRGNGRAAGGMVIYGYTATSCRTELYRAGKCFGNLNSSFLAEMLALEWALGALSATFVGGALW
ncbi:unnamed protein product [Prorocentrum cordatum]|uniref:Reverse transcriptase domain-containing protein n=1 Tax=Prorocentrum cordatum TaxID=2364126 RepID=A0ABN9TPF3_9DINO|nr:unnamed protein product [Polarella glacialis]